MKYDFDNLTNRRNTNSLKWDVSDNEIPMWVADMDFKTCPEVLDAIKSKIDVGALGYTIIPDNWYEAYISWWKNKHHFTIEKEWMSFASGVVATISSSVRRVSEVGDNIVVLTPAYDIFFHSIENNGRKTLECPLKYINHTYSIDFEDLENKFKDPKTTMMIFCNPHNPIGKIWSKEELEKVGELAHKYNVTVLSDEIHCDLTNPNKEYIPFASVNDINLDLSITCISPSKAFNLAGLHSSAVVIKNESLRKLVFKGLNDDEVAEPNIIAIEGSIAAFTKGESWLNQLRKYLYSNKQTVALFLKQQTKDIYLIQSDATYLLWVDVSKYTDDAISLRDDIRRSTGLYLSAGNQYRGNGNKFLRINIACPRTILLDGIQRLTYYISNK